MHENEKLPFEEETYSTDLNGYVDFTNVPESQQKVTYQNFMDGNANNQKIISLTDIASSCLVRKNDEGELQFALIETITPSTLGREGYSGITLEVPFFALPQKDTMSYEDIVSIIDKGILDLNLYMEGNSTEAISDKRTYLPLHDVAKNIHLMEPTHVAVKLGVLLAEDYVREMEKAKENDDKSER